MNGQNALNSSICGEPRLSIYEGKGKRNLESMCYLRKQAKIVYCNVHRLQHQL